MRQLFVGLALIVSLSLATPVLASDTAASDGQIYTRGRVVEVLAEQSSIEAFLDNAEQTVLVEILKGEDAGRIVTIIYTFSTTNYTHQRLQTGDEVVLTRVIDARGDNYYVIDHYRLPAIVVYLCLFALTACILARQRGAGSVLGLAASLVILMLYVVPRIIAGDSPLTVSFIGAGAIATVSIVLAHGFRRRTFVALGATLAALVVAFVLAILAAALASLSGAGTEEAVYLQFSYLTDLDLRGLLLGGIIIGTLGVLDDVTTTQVATVEELSLANPNLSAAELYKRGLSVGREHIAALVNTLILAYAGASFPLFLLFVLPDNPPLWIVLNNEHIVEEILRALVGGSALMLAVPISTVLAAGVFGALIKPDPVSARSGSHRH